MSHIRILMATAAVLATTAVAQSANAAAAPAAAPAAAAAGAPNPLATNPPPGPPIPGLCVVSVERAIALSTVGKAFDARLTQLASQVQAELNPERAGLQTEANTLQGQQASLAADVFQQRATALNQRIQAYGAKEELRDRELQATQQKNLQRITAEMPPLLVAAYTARRCSLVVGAEAVIGVNPAMDLTDDVMKALNGKMTTIAFDRERLDQQAAAAPAAGAPARR